MDVAGCGCGRHRRIVRQRQCIAQHVHHDVRAYVHEHKMSADKLVSNSGGNSGNWRMIGINAR